MKLSMWMIANRLSNLELELDIREKAPVVLNSARIAYATNCLHVYKEKDYVVCDGEGDRIIVRDMDSRQVFEIMQGVFDYYEDWQDSMGRAIRARDYQQVVDLAWQVFGNPMVLMDGNYLVLGMTRQYPADSMDDEWNYLHTYGCTSINALNQLRKLPDPLILTKNATESFGKGNGRQVRYGGMIHAIYCNHAQVGQLILLSKERELNPGDRQLLDIIGELLEPHMGQVYYQNVMKNSNVFHSVILGRPYEKQQLQVQLDYRSWNYADTFALTVLELEDDEASDRKEERRAHLDRIASMIGHNLPQVVIVRVHSRILLLGNYIPQNYAFLMDLLRDLERQNPIRIAFSLPCRGIEQVGQLYDQVCYALDESRMREPAKKEIDFFDYGLNYLLESDSLSKSIRACMPTVIQLWEMQQTSGDELFQTLKVYLDCERSISRAAESLFTHRNTVAYRIRKIEEVLKRDLDEPYVRHYCRLSIHLLELYRQRNQIL